MRSVSVCVLLIAAALFVAGTTTVRAEETESDSEVDQSALYDDAVAEDSQSNEEMDMQAGEEHESDVEANGDEELTGESSFVEVDAEADAALEAEVEAEVEAEMEASAESESESESEDSSVEAEVEAEAESEAGTESEEFEISAVETDATPAPAPNSLCLQKFDAKAFAEKAVEYEKSYIRQKITYSQPNRSFGPNPKTKQNDCSGFVTSILDSLQYNCLWPTTGTRNTRDMKTAMVQRGGFHQTPKIGDIVMWSGHTGIITARDDCPKGKYELVAMGSHGAKTSGCQTIEKLKTWGSGTWLGFWTPHHV